MPRSDRTPEEVERIVADYFAMLEAELKGEGYSKAEHNHRLGRLGEEWVLEFEQKRLHDEERRPDLARKVEWIADTRGDGAGYDIASFTPTPRSV